MSRIRSTLVGVCALLLALGSARTATAQPAPSGPHPRLWLDASTLSALAEQASQSGSGVAHGAKRCAAARQKPGDYSTGGWQGFEFVTTLSGCLVSWKASGSADDLATAIKYWNVLLDDYTTVGDGAGGDDVVKHDAGYAMRTFAPYSALAYDWLHDADGVTEALRAHARGRFAAWMKWYGDEGYLEHMPGTNYQAGYLYAATLIAIAEGGEAGTTGDEHWATLRDGLFGTDMKKALAPGGVLDGGDWAEGWQYGPLSVAEYGLSARAITDNGVSIDGLDAWATGLVKRFVYSLTPSDKKMFAAGDTESDSPYIDPPNGALVAVLAGPGDDQAKAWARQLLSDLSISIDDPLFETLTQARSGASQAFPSDAPLGYLAAGVGNWYLRSSWKSDALWSVFQCAPRLVADHQHPDAGNWVLTRGADDVVFDPTPYGALSTLTSNAPAVDSAILPAGDSPSQGVWGKATRLVWTKQLTSGTAVARCDYSDQYRFEDTPSDVPTALRDFVWVPDGTNAHVVIFDRVVTGTSSRALHLRVRTPATLKLSGNVASGTQGGSALFVEKAWATSGAPSVRSMPEGKDCYSSDRGTCDVSRLPGTEYRIEVKGPTAQAIHVIDALAAGSSAPDAQVISGDGYRGVLIARENKRVVVVANDTADGAVGASLGYAIPAGFGALHVVVDAPVGSEGRSEVLGAVSGKNCTFTVTPHAGGSGGYDGHPLVFGSNAACTLLKEGQEPGDMGGAGGTAGAKATDSGGGCGCRSGSGSSGTLYLVAALAGGLWLAVRSRRARGRLVR